MSRKHTIREYIQSEPPHARAALKKLHAILKKAAPRAGEKLAWGMPTLTQDGNLVLFAAFKNHLSLFAGTGAVKHFKSKLNKFTTTKAAIHFPYGEALPAGLIRQVVKFCARENKARLAARAAKVKKKKRKK